MSYTDLLVKIINIQKSKPQTEWCYNIQKNGCFQKNGKRWCVYFRQICISAKGYGFRTWDSNYVIWNNAWPKF